MQQAQIGNIKANTAFTEAKTTAMGGLREMGDLAQKGFAWLKAQPFFKPGEPKTPIDYESMYNTSSLLAGPLFCRVRLLLRARVALQPREPGYAEGRQRQGRFNVVIEVRDKMRFCIDCDRPVERNTGI